MEIQNNYTTLLEQIKETVNIGRVSAVKAARRQMVLTYWAVGRHIIEFEQGGKEKAVYGTKILNRLSKDLSDQLGKGFSRTNLISTRLIYLKYKNINLLSDRLTWSHFVELSAINNDLERIFYKKQAKISYRNIIVGDTK